jgi:serine/threonine-protein kinase RsbT
VPAGYDEILEVVCRHVSLIHARAALDRALAASGADPRRLGSEQLPAIIARLERGVALFLTARQLDTMRQELEALVGAPPIDLRAESIELSAEDDIIAARGRAREVALRMGGTRLTAQKAATIVSELARNIISYAKRGRIELRPDLATRRLQIIATDQGPGIAELEAILAGQYRSRTGLGLGLRGCRNLADKMDVETSDRGTRISVEVAT